MAVATQPVHDVDGSVAQLSALLNSGTNGTPLEIVNTLGERAVLPPMVVRVLISVVQAMTGNSFGMQVDEPDRFLTTQQGAQMLGITRPTFVTLLENGEIPFQQPGVHRRILAADVVSYKQKQLLKQRAALDQVMAISADTGLYESTIQPRSTR